MGDKSYKFGKEGEKAAVKFLKKKGYRILATGYRTKIGEIDIVAEQKKTVVFVEVKTRSGGGFGAPHTAVTPAKQRKIYQVAQCFLVEHKVVERECRFDVVSIIGDPEDPKSWGFELIPDAFRS